ncbi:MAG TPA: hypothetical protein VK988_17710, partial [Acidimicrobiales bacterium]|nr:hypothetical protein [Acidimicrobiales bacterium]
GKGGIEAVGAAARGNQDDLRGFIDMIASGDRRLMQAGESGLKRALEDIDAGLSKLVEGGTPDRAAEALRRFAAAQNVRVEDILPRLELYNGALKASETAARLSGAAAEEAGSAVSGFGEAQTGANAALEQGQVVTEAQKAEMEALKASYEQLGSSVSEFVNPMDAFNTVLQRNEEAARKHAEEIAASTADSKDSWEDYATEATVSLQDFAAEQEKQIAAYDAFTNNLFQIAARGRADVARELAAMGPEGAVLAEQFVTATDDQFNSYGDTLVEAAQKKPELAGQNLDTGFKILAVIADQGSAATVESVMNQLGPLPGLTEEVVRDTAQRANVALADGRPAWDLEWGGRKTISLEEMQRVANEAPPEVQRATNAINQYLIDTNPQFAAQFALRRGVSIEEMQTMLRDAPPHVQKSAQLYNEHLAGQLQGFIDQMATRKNASVGEMEAMLRDAPPIVLSAGQAYVQKLIDTNPAFAGQMAARKNVSVEEMRAMLRDAPPIAEDVAWALVGALEGRLPPFEFTVGRYSGALLSGVRVVSGALTPFLANRGPGPITAAEGAVIDYYAAGGMKEKHVAQIAQAGSWRVWAEPETGGEAYIPLALAKRERSTAILEEVASRFGLAVTDFKNLPPGQEYHAGGFWDHDDHDHHEGCQHFHSGGLYVPPPHPQFADFGPPMRPAGSGTTHNMQEATAEWARRHMKEAHHQAPPPVPGGVGGAPGADPGGSGGNIVAVGRRMQGMGYRVGEQPSFGGVAPVHTKNSYHYRGRAIDVNWYPANQEPAKLDYLHGWIRQNVSPITELLWRTKGHYGHLHLAMLLGGLVDFRSFDQGGTLDNGLQSFDQGGWLQPGMTLAHNGTGQPERVIALKHGGLVGDTFYGDPGGFGRRGDRFDDEEGAQFDYAKNRKERRFYAHERLDAPLQRPEKRDRDDNGDRDKVALDRLMNGYVPPDRAGGSAPFMAVPVNQSNDHSVNFSIGAGAVRVDVRAEVGADPSALQAQIVSA